MIKKVQTFLGLSWFRKKLFFQTLGYSMYTSVLFSFYKKKARFGETISLSEFGQIPDQRAMDISWAIQTTATLLPWKNVCRHQAYQAKLLCKHYHIPCLIFIGFKKDKEKKTIEAHAWTVAGGKIITGFCNPDEYVAQTIYSNR